MDFILPNVLLEVDIAFGRILIVIDDITWLNETDFYFYINKKFLK